MTARLLYFLAFCNCISAAQAHKKSCLRIDSPTARCCTRLPILQTFVWYTGQVPAGPALQCSPVRATFLRTITAPTSLLADKHNFEAGTSHQPCHGRGHCQLSFFFSSLGINGTVHQCVTARGRTLPNRIPSRGDALAGIPVSVTIR